MTSLEFGTFTTKKTHSFYRKIILQHILDYVLPCRVALRKLISLHGKFTQEIQNHDLTLQALLLSKLDKEAAVGSKGEGICFEGFFHILIPLVTSSAFMANY